MTAALLLAAIAAAEPVQWSLRGDATRAVVIAAIEDGWHIYSISQPDGGPVATRIWLGEGQRWSQRGAVAAPTPRARFDAAFGMTVETYQGRAEFVIPIKGAGPLRVHAHYQACNSRECLPPRTATLNRAAESRRRVR